MFTRIAPVIVPLVCISCTSETPFPAAEEARFAAALAETRESQQSPGAIISVDDGQHRYEGAIGWADEASMQPMLTTTPYRTASLGKTFTGALILALHDDGLLSVDDPVSSYLPSFPNGDAITLRMLLTHTSGVLNYTRLPDFATRRYTADEAIAAASEQPLDFPPGTAWNYSNTGYLILAKIAEQLTGRSMPEEVQARFFAPLGMTHTWPFEESRVAEIATGYQLRSGAAQPVSFLDANIYPADGGWVSTAGDLLIWARAAFGGELHSESTLATARVPEGGELLDEIARSFGLDSGGYALGFIQAHDPELGTLYAGAGNAGGMRTFVGYFPEHDLAFTTFVDVGDGTVPLVETLSAVRPILGALRAHIAAP
ncbi:MAG: serine hydrolase domain-containing protein [Sandaracinaceae bacterium]